MRDSILRVIDDLETKQYQALQQSLMQDSPYWHGYWTGNAGALDYAIKELRKVLDDARKNE